MRFFVNLLTKVIIASYFLLPLSFAQENIDFEGIAEEAKQEEKSATELENEYFEWALEHRKQVFNWNHRSSVLIFFFVMAIISMGLYFSYMQFRESGKGAGNLPLPESTMKIGQGGVEISSSIIGLLILVVSLGFFYLYLENVYPVQTSPLLGIPEENDSD